ncbi:hypothetical protein GCM10027290_49740 [Micromonospora sonneratiae]|uniref:TNT domain-containing protein n=1 Tax=Micromonospora sonneratiae TaxID=1184706 RepID=A0ABW3YL57_9ACTN
MRGRRAFLAVLASTALVLAQPITASGAGRASGIEAPAPAISQPPCRPETPDAADPTQEFHAGNPLLGPAKLPIALPVGPLVTDYRRFGALSQEEFVEQYGNAAKDGWVYPPALGFVILPNGRPVKFPYLLQSGSRIDRFGFPGGTFLAPAGTPYARRALPPNSLNTPIQAPLSNYHVYCVVRPFIVDAGPIAPWFAQPGLGFQYKLEQKYLPEAGPALNVTWLLNNGYLVEERPGLSAPVGDSAGRNNAGTNDADRSGTGRNMMLLLHE